MRLFKLMVALALVMGVAFIGVDAVDGPVRKGLTASGADTTRGDFSPTRISPQDAAPTAAEAPEPPSQSASTTEAIPDAVAETDAALREPATPVIADQPATADADTRETDQPLPVAVSEAAPAALPLRYVSADAINVRAGPSTGFGVVGRLTRGEAVLIVDAAPGWVHVRIEGDGIDGWVAERLLTE